MLATLLAVTVTFGHVEKPGDSATPAVVQPAPPAGESTQDVHLTLRSLSATAPTEHYQVGLGSEAAVGGGVTMEIAFDYEHHEDPPTAVSHTANIFSLRIAPHYYFARTPRRGPYLAPYASVAYVTVETEMAGAGAGFSFGATAGWSWLLGRAVFKAGLGIEMAWMTVDLREPGGGASSLGRSGLLPRLDLSVGLSF